MKSAFEKIMAGVASANAFSKGELSEGRVHVRHRGTLARIEIERGKHGLFYATSPDVKGLFVAAPTVPELLFEIPRVLDVMA